VARLIFLLPFLLCLFLNVAQANDFQSNEKMEKSEREIVGVDEFGYPLPARTEACRKLRHLRTVSDPTEIFSADGSLPACVDTRLAQFMHTKSTACSDNNCGNTYPGGCDGLLERVFPYDHDYYRMIADCRESGAR
jgi:hypothetical protein